MSGAGRALAMYFEAPAEQRLGTESMSVSVAASDAGLDSRWSSVLVAAPMTTSPWRTPPVEGSTIGGTIGGTSR